MRVKLNAPRSCWKGRVSRVMNFPENETTIRDAVPYTCRDRDGKICGYCRKRPSKEMKGGAMDEAKPLSVDPMAWTADFASFGTGASVARKFAFALFVTRIYGAIRCGFNALALRPSSVRIARARWPVGAFVRLVFQGDRVVRTMSPRE